MKFILALLPLFIVSCATNQKCCELRTEKYIIVDTIVIPGQHIHHPDKSMCVYLEDMKFCISDTIYLDFYEPKKKMKNK